MSCPKRKFVGGESGQGEEILAVKRSCISKDSSPSDLQSVVTPPNNEIRKYSAEERARVLSILDCEFENELQAKEDEVVEIEQRILKAQKTLQYLCYAVVSDFYSREKTITPVASTRQRRIHPAVKKLLAGKSPRSVPESSISEGHTVQEGISVADSNLECKDNRNSDPCVSSNTASLEKEEGKKVPRYIPPKPKASPLPVASSKPIRGGQNKIKKTIVIGNVSKWLPPESRDDAASHKWMVYVRGPKENSDISDFVSKVRFFLHPSYRPNDVVQVVSPPFQLSRRGWGEFPIRVQLHFINALNKPVDVIHTLKLDKTCTGLQTLGSETVVEVWVYTQEHNGSVIEINDEICEEESARELSNDGLESICYENTGKEEPKAEVKLENIISGYGDQLNIISSVPSISSSPGKVNALPDPVLSECSKRTPSKKEAMIQIISHIKKSSPPKVSESASVQKSALLQAKVEDVSVQSSVVPSVTSTTSKKEVMKIISPAKNSSPLKTSDVTSIQKSIILQASVESSIVSSTTSTISQNAKPMTVVKCLDAKGNIRFVQLSPDAISKVLKGTAANQKSLIGAQNQILRLSTPNTAEIQTAREKVVNQVKGSEENSDQKKGILTNAASKMVETSVLTAVQTTSVQLSSPSPTKQPLRTSVVSTANLTSASLNVSLVPSVTVSSIPNRPAVSGSRPILRIIRPGGNPNARPMLVPTGSFPRFQAPFKGVRPVLMLRDGKLFMTRQPLNSIPTSDSVNSVGIVNNNSIGTIPSLPQNKQIVAKCVSSVGLPNEISLSQVKSDNRTTVLKTSTVATQSLSHPIMSSGMHNNLAAAKQQIPPPSQKVNNIPIVTESLLDNTASSAKLTSCIKSPQLLQNTITSTNTVKSLVKPVFNDQIVETDRGNVVVVHRASMGSFRSSVKPGKSILKSGISLLKANISCSPTQSTPSSPLSSPSISPCPSPGINHVNPSNKRIILGRASGPSTITSTSQRGKIYKELIALIISSCPCGPGVDVWRAVRWMVKNLPLVHTEANQLEFKLLHPYCAPDEKTFCSWNIGKQRACEWLRAKTVLRLLSDAGWDSKELWTTKEVAIWARLHGYTPGLPLNENEFENDIDPRNVDTPELTSNCKIVCQYNTIKSIDNWLQIREGRIAVHSNLPSEESDEELDIVSCDLSPSKVRIKKEPVDSGEEVLSEEENLPLDQSLHHLSEFVTSALNQIRIKLAPEPIEPGLNYPSAQRVMIQTVKSLMEDLVRRSFAYACGTCISKQPKEITTSNLCGAILERPELDLLSCVGLGISSTSEDTA